jgi:hypothetical protein
LSPTAGFPASLALTLALLALVVATGLRAKRRWHIPLVALALASLGVTIRFAFLLGKLYDLPAAGAITPIHLTLAKITTACYLLPIATGLRTIFAPATRRLHRKLAFVVLGMTVLTAITGTAMLLLSPRVNS